MNIIFLVIHKNYVSGSPKTAGFPRNPATLEKGIKNGFVKHVSLTVQFVTGWGRQSRPAQIK